MTYILSFNTEKGDVRFKFDKLCNLLEILEQLIESTDGFEEGKTKIVIETHIIEALTTREL